MKQDRNIIFLDKVPDRNWTFESDLERLSGMNFQCIYMDTHNMQGRVTNIFRYLSYFVLPLYGVIHRKEIKTIVAWQQFYGLLYAFWCRVLHLKKKGKVIILTFIYKGKKGIIGKIYSWLLHYIVTSGYVDKFVCFSEPECRRYAEEFGVSESLFIPCNLTIEDRIEEYEDLISDKGYYLSAGRSNRDYDFLCELFKTMPERKLYIICDRFRSDKEIPNNVRVLDNVHGKAYFEYLAACKAVLLPLKSDCISAGQLVLLQSMMLKKICIVTETETMKNYVENGINAIFMHNNVSEVAELLEKIEGGLYRHVSDQARTVYERKYSGTRIAEVVSSILKER